VLGRLDAEPLSETDKALVDADLVIEIATTGHASGRLAVGAADLALSVAVEPGPELRAIDQGHLGTSICRRRPGQDSEKHHDGDTVRARPGLGSGATPPACSYRCGGTFYGSQANLDGGCRNDKGLAGAVTEPSHSRVVERRREALGGVAARLVGEVLLGRLDVGVAHPLHDLPRIGGADRVGTEGVAQVVEAKLA
jgi:hypothetical protein